MATNKRHTESNKYNKHLTQDDRITLSSIIEANRDYAGSFKLLLNDVGNIMKKDPSTLSKEVKNHRNFRYGSKGIKSKNICDSCDKKKKCDFRSNDLKSICPCNEFKYVICKHLKKFPWVCNGCRKKSYCTLDKYYYSATQANNAYEETLHESRAGINMLKSEFDLMDEAISKGLTQGKALDIIVHENSSVIPYSTRSIYNFIHKGYISARPIDTRRMVKLRKKPHKTQNSVILRKEKIGKHYQDFLEYIGDNQYSNVIEMDTVESKKEPGQKYLLSLHHVKTHFQIAILLDDKEAGTVVTKLNELHRKLEDRWNDIFEVILTDNGTEFTDINGILSNPDTGEVRTNLFYCNPLSSGQKGHCEKNHTLIRYILPKGSSFKNLTQDKIDLMMSHINSYKRKSTDYSTPFELFRATFGPKVLDILNIKEIPEDQINLKPQLLD